MSIKGNQRKANTNKNLNNKQLRIPMAENFVGEENLEISSNQQKGRVDSPIHCLNLAASNIILVGGTTYLSGLEG